jgi:hypothetical protein
MIRTMELVQPEPVTVQCTVVNPEYLKSLVYNTIENIDLVHGVKPDAFPRPSPFCTHVGVVAEKIKSLERFADKTLGIALVAFQGNIQVDFLNIGLSPIGDFKR